MAKERLEFVSFPMWQFRPKSSPQQTTPVPQESLALMLQNGVVGPDHEFLPPGASRWISAGEVVHVLAGGSSEIVVVDEEDDDDIPMGEPVQGAAAPPATQASPAAPHKTPAMDRTTPILPPAPQQAPRQAPLSPLPEPASTAKPKQPSSSRWKTGEIAPPSDAPVARAAPTAKADAPGQPAAPATTGGAADGAGGGAANGNERKRISARFEEDDELEMTPMIDMTFLLLVFFMVASTISQFGKLELPDSMTGDAENPDERVILVLDFPEALDETSRERFNGAKPLLFANAKMRIHGQDADIASTELETRLAEAFGDKPSPQLILQAHRKMPASIVREVLKIAKKAGAQETLVGVSVPR